MNLLMVICCLSALTEIHSNTVTSPQIRILDVATKASETRLIPHHVEYRNSFHPYFQEQNRHGQSAGPLKSYVIYDQYPVKIFKEWKANPPADFPPSVPQNFLEVNRNVEFSPEYYFQNGQQALPPPKPTLAYRSVYSNVIKVFDNSLDGLERNRFPSERYVKPFEGNVWKSPVEYEPVYPQDLPRRQPYHNLPENFPKVFSPNEKFHFPSFDEGVPYPPKFFQPQGGFYDTQTINFDKDNTRHRDEVEVLPDVQQKNQKRAFLCGFIRVNQRQFPENGGPCGRSDDDMPLVAPEYPDYSNLPNDKIPVEHRRQHIQIKRIKRSGLNKTYENRQKRNAVFGYSSWGSPFGYDNGYDSYFGDGYSNRNYGNSGYGNNRNRYQNNRNRYYSGSRYDEYDDDYQNNDDSNRGLTGYLTNGGRRYKNRNHNNNDDDDDNDDDNNNNNNDNNRDNESDEEMERMNSNRRDTNDRRNNDDRDRRRNNNNNNNNNNSNNNNNNNNYDDDDDYRDNRRNNNNNNNNNNRNNNRRYNNNNNNNNNNNSNSRRYNNNNNNNDRYNNNRNRYYSNSGSNGYNNNYGSSYGGYGSNYGGGYGSGGYGSSYGSNGGYGGYGSSYGGNGGYGSSYGGNGGYGYGGYGNGFGSF